MSRPTQQKLEQSLTDISDALEGKRVRLPYATALIIGDEIRYARKAADDLSKFVALSNSAFEALEGLLANWPTTEQFLHYEPEAHRPVLMKDKALEQAADALRKYREIEGDFGW